jgi:hypothetical protein
MNVEYFLQLIKQGKNPEQLMLNFLQTQMSSNPVGANLLQLAQNNNTAGIEQFARNLCASKGLDFDKEFTNFKNNLKL